MTQSPQSTIKAEHLSYLGPVVSLNVDSDAFGLCLLSNENVEVSPPVLQCHAQTLLRILYSKQFLPILAAT
jgi:hypothetical protein